MNQNKPQDESKKSGGDSIREKLTLTIAGFVLTGLVGGSLTTWIQQRGWAWQNRMATVEKDVANVVAANKAASELVNLRWRAAYVMTRALEREEDADAYKSAYAEFEAADKQWALQYSNIARDVEFNVDAPFGVRSEDLSKIWTIECGRKAAVVPFDTQSARTLIEAVNHCQGGVKSLLEPLIDADLSKRRMTRENKEIVNTAWRRLDHLYRLNDVLRCVIFDRAYAIRNSQNNQSYWSTFFGVNAAHYDIGRKLDSCL